MHVFKLSQDALDYARRRTGREHPLQFLKPEETAVLIIDMQNYFVDPEFIGASPASLAIIPNINRLTQAARALGATVVFVKHTLKDTERSWSVYHEDLQDEQRGKLRRRTLSEDHAGFELHPLLVRDAADLTVVKDRFSPFSPNSSDLHELLRARGIANLIITGTATNVCCETTGRDAMMLNYRVVMVSDATSARSDDVHAASLNAFHGLFGDVRTTRDAIAVLVGSSSDGVKEARGGAR